MSQQGVVASIPKKVNSMVVAIWWSQKSATAVVSAKVLDTSNAGWLFVYESGFRCWCQPRLWVRAV